MLIKVVRVVRVKFKALRRVVVMAILKRKNSIN